MKSKAEHDADRLLWLHRAAARSGMTAREYIETRRRAGLPDAGALLEILEGVEAACVAEGWEGLYEHVTENIRKEANDADAGACRD